MKGTKRSEKRGANQAEEGESDRLGSGTRDGQIGRWEKYKKYISREKTL